MTSLLFHANHARTMAGFLSVEETLELCAGNAVLDPLSLLVSFGVEIGKGNTFFPNIVIERRDNSKISIADNNVFASNIKIMASGTGQIHIGSTNEFGDGGVILKANRDGAHISIGNAGRYLGGLEVFGRSRLGHGSQILGRISVLDCDLEDGESYRYNDPDMRAAVLKGHGTARSIRLKKGEVLNGLGNFDIENIERQTLYHQKLNND